MLFDFHRLSSQHKRTVTLRPHSLAATIANQLSKHHTAVKDSRATGGIVLNLISAHELLRLPDVRMRRRRRRLKYCMRSASRANWRARCKSSTFSEKKRQFTHEAPISGWFSGSTRRINSSAFSPITRASYSRPSSEYMIAKLRIAVLTGCCESRSLPPQPLLHPLRRMPSWMLSRSDALEHSLVSAFTRPSIL